MGEASGAQWWRIVDDTGVATLDLKYRKDSQTPTPPLITEQINCLIKESGL